MIDRDKHAVDSISLENPDQYELLEREQGQGQARGRLQRAEGNTRKTRGRAESSGCRRPSANYHILRNHIWQMPKSKYIQTVLLSHMQVFEWLPFFVLFKLAFNCFVYV